MFRLLQGDVGSGKTIVSFIAAKNIINNNQQVAIMAPTEILAKQHYNLFVEIFGKKINSTLLTGKLKKSRKSILQNLEKGKINIIFGTHSLFQKKNYHKLGLIIVDEQHKFGVNQRKSYQKKED